MFRNGLTGGRKNTALYWENIDQENIIYKIDNI